MKAVMMYAPGDLRVEEVPAPVPRDDEVLIKVAGCGVCGSDIPRINTYGAHISPIIPGHEFSGEVVEAGKSVKDYNVGDRVTVPPLIPCFKCEWCEKGLYSLCDDYDYYGSRRNGAFAQYVAVNEGNLLRLPENVSYLDAATTDPAANAIHGITQAGLREGETFIAYGAGPIGLFGIQVAKVHGASKVISIDLGERKIEVVRQIGADVVIDALQEDPEEVVARETGGKMADVVIDFTGAPTAQKKAIHLAAKMGRVVYLGISHKGLEYSEEEVDKIMRGQLAVIGSWNSFTKPFPGNDWFEALQLFSEGKLTSNGTISHALSLDEAPEMFRKIAAGGLFYNKIMFLPNGEPQE
ncbi:MAG: galactitol-1-phosphate 5-dehydrogenase [Clostridiales Family XIII bacterium]|jgi:L-iditol 2-dehydrogenase|nr:galactitol-1-phosphate 5-dehydrogenase [Clostridiales Family XIII bacterium]